MFKFLLFSFFAVSIYANSNNYVPSGTVMDNAKLVTEKGWKAANKDLIKHIEVNQESFLKVFMVVDDKPFSDNDYYTKRDLVSFLPYFDEHYYALALTKYYESLGENVKSIFIYNYILSGLNKSYFSYPSSLGLIYRLVIEERTIKSLQNSLSANVYSQKDKFLIKEILTHYLILNKNVVFDALTVDLKSTISSLNNVLRNDICVSSLREGIELNIKFGEVLDLFINLDTNYLSKMKSIKNKKEYRTLCKKMETGKIKVNEYENILDRFSTCQLMFDEELKTKVANILYFKSPNGMILYNQIIERIETNKALIIELDTYNSSSSHLLGSKNRRLIDMRNVLK